ncbi:MAG: transposase, partial [Candidatus Omnitrophica bacterium]|nr:transposase [Candidatus Omnitrophota bacterium]MBU1852272.1 transposase [Candidatus Omnitrophota bacterium]
MNDIGKIIHGSWLWLADRYDYVDLDEFIVMPNHVHGIIMIVDSAVGANNYSPTKSQRAQRPHGTSKTIGSIIRGFK